MKVYGFASITFLCSIPNASGCKATLHLDKLVGLETEGGAG